ncbi:hypothetical protein [Candidatus Palauibacter sp.]|uniref:hypothetical protein n=1 Tax=Candidatus Palauibacter sp. TaxID=3101350 RepID=UPI003B01A0BF
MLIPAWARRWREVAAELDAEALGEAARYERLEPGEDAATAAPPENGRDASRQLAWEEWEQEQAKLRELAAKLRRE